uniref:Uncharacterized protein n=1 Tax=Anopheles coluzzii TaxID=1518534 RepID=A0A8W7PXL0_ANOCL
MPMKVENEYPSVIPSSAKDIPGKVGKTYRLMGESVEESSLISVSPFKARSCTSSGRRPLLEQYLFAPYHANRAAAPVCLWNGVLLLLLLLLHRCPKSLPQGHYGFNGLLSLDHYLGLPSAEDTNAKERI